MTQRTPIVRDVADGFTLDNRGAPAYALRTVEPIRAYLPPPPLRKTNRLRRVAIIASVAVLLAMLALVAVALTADAASDGPVRGQRYRVCKMIAIDPPTWRCRWMVVR